jgi:hypothetical protein
MNVGTLKIIARNVKHFKGFQTFLLPPQPTEYNL